MAVIKRIKSPFAPMYRRVNGVLIRSPNGEAHEKPFVLLYISTNGFSWAVTAVFRFINLD
jgi:hypothetical protein